MEVLSQSPPDDGPRAEFHRRVKCGESSPIKLTPISAGAYKAGHRMAVLGRSVILLDGGACICQRVVEIQ